jgi:hexosaminidase
MAPASFLAVFPALILSSDLLLATADAVQVWPIPRQVSVSGPAWYTLSENITVQLQQPHTATLLQSGALRYQSILRRQAARAKRLHHLPAAGVVTRVNVQTSGVCNNLTVDTDYSYSVNVSSAATATITATSCYGALYGLESLSQLSFKGMLQAVAIEDKPMYRYRGLMLDTGRRFHPVYLVKSMLDAMATVKMNVLHFHLSDQCRFSVESKLFPEVTAKLVGPQAGHYTQDDIREIVAYAGDRGIRVIPEFDVPGHTGGWIALVPRGIQYCGSFPAHEERPQLFHDSHNMTLGIVTSLLHEMSMLFPDEYFNVGADETFKYANQWGPNCTGSNSGDFEAALVSHVISWGKRVMGWNSLHRNGPAIRTNTGSNASDTALVFWNGALTDLDVATKNIDGIAASEDHSYLDHGSPASNYWWDIRPPDLAPGFTSLALLGGEACHWTDKYCYIFECLPTWHDPPSGGGNNISGWMYPPTMDDVFSESLSGKVWPRAAASAGSYWNFNGSVFNDIEPLYNFITGVLIDRGVASCPANCTCTELERCGEPYPGAPPKPPHPPPSPSPSPPRPPPSPPPPGAEYATFTRVCDPVDTHQLIEFKPLPPQLQPQQQQQPTSGDGIGSGQLVNSKGLCVDRQTITKSAPLNFMPCETFTFAGSSSSTSSTQVWQKQQDGSFSQQLSAVDATGSAGISSMVKNLVCLDSFGPRGAGSSPPSVVGVWPCGGKAGDQKEVWVTANGGKSLKEAYDGRCLSDAP